ncbi:TerB family tellurite resistance protein [Hyphomicrobiales bacterium]|nr:TerB family tellurite resistance protein [Hyphomicrobiales bacterium]
MLKFLKNLFGKKHSDNENNESETYKDLEDYDVIEAVTVMLLRAANIDGHKDEKEILLIKKLLNEQFSLNPSEVELLISSSSEKEEESTDLYKWSKIINDNYSKEKKNIVFGLMCEIVNADDVIDPFESNFIRRLSGLLYISDKEAGMIKKKILGAKEK